MKTLINVEKTTNVKRITVIVFDSIYAFNICNSRLFTFVTVRQPSNVKMVINVIKITNIKRITQIVCDT